MTVDVTVRGAGIFGLSVAWSCARRGARVQVVDPYGVGAGASGGIVGALAPHVPENWNSKKQFQVESLVMAQDWWAEVAAAGGGDPGYARTGRLQPLADAAAVTLAEARAAGAVPLWQGKARWEVIRDVAGQSPGFAPPSPTGQYVFDTLSARLHPARACGALAAALLAQGVPVLAEAPDQGAVIWATGAQGLLDLSTALGRNVGQGIKGQAALLGHDAKGQPQLFVDGLHIIPHADGTTAIGSTTERDFDHPTETDSACDALIARARALVPALQTAPVLQRWAGLRPRAKSRAPLVGPWPGRPGQYVLNGGFKIGFGMAPKLAEDLATLVLTGQDILPPEFHTSQMGAPQRLNLGT